MNAKTDWIPLSERLPDPHVWVLVCGEGWLAPTTGRYCPQKHAFFTDAADYADYSTPEVGEVVFPMLDIIKSPSTRHLVTHWMPCPVMLDGVDRPRSPWTR